jgi:hypothetical protein
MKQTFYDITICLPSSGYCSQGAQASAGLLYYKARYYDPGLGEVPHHLVMRSRALKMVRGRFIQADEEVHPESVQGMNRCMYAEGNPIKNSDDSGYRLSTPLAWAWIEVLTMNEDSTHEERVVAFARGYVKGNDIRKKEKEAKKHEKIISFLDKAATFYYGAAAISGILGFKFPLFWVAAVVFFSVGKFYECTSKAYENIFVKKNSSHNNFTYKDSYGSGSENVNSQYPPDTIFYTPKEEDRNKQKFKGIKISCGQV